jgi:hypothetical protein
MWNADNCTACTCSKGTTPIVCDGTLGAGRCTKDLNSLAQSWWSIYRQPSWYSHGIIIKYWYLANEKLWAIFTVNLELCIRAMIMLSYKMCFEPDLVMWDMKLTQWQALSYLYSLELRHCFCVCNDKVEYNGGQNTTSLLVVYSFGVNKQHVSAYSEAIIRFTNVSYRRLITMCGYVVRCWDLII